MGLPLIDIGVLVVKLIISFMLGTGGCINRAMAVGLGLGKYRIGSFMWRGRGAPVCAFSNQNEGLISSMHEVTQGDRFFQEKNLP